MTRNSKVTKPLRMLGVFGCLVVFSLTGCSSTGNSKSNTSTSSKASSSEVSSSSEKRSVSQSTKPKSWESKTAKEFANALRAPVVDGHLLEKKWKTQVYGTNI